MALKISEARREGDYGKLAGLWIMAAEAELWDIDRLPLYLSCLEEAIEAWNSRC